MACKAPAAEAPDRLGWRNSPWPWAANSSTLSAICHSEVLAMVRPLHIGLLLLKDL